jgi:hypothetical protein
MAIHHKPSGSVVTISNDDHPALVTALERALIAEKDVAIAALTAAKDWADFEKRRGEINGLNAAIAICRSVNKTLQA